MMKLNLRLHSINFIHDLFDHNDSVRMTVATFPDMQKHDVILEYKDIYNSITSFKLRYNDQTNMMIIYFQKKGFFKDGEVIGSALIHTKDIDESKDGHLKIEIHEINPTSETKDNKNKNKNNNHYHNKGKNTRKTIGSLKMNFIIKETFETEEYDILSIYDKNNENSFFNKNHKKCNSRVNESQYVFN